MLVDRGDVLVVDKPPGVAVHGGRTEGADVVGRLRAWLEAQGRESTLGVHQRLDQDASGVLAFSRSAEAARAVATDIEGHRARRTYVAVVRRGDLADSGELVDRLETRRDGTTRVVARGGKLASARYSVLRRSVERALVEVELETGRTHQIRVQLASRGSPVVGDVVYGGDRALRLMLHATRLKLPAVDAEARAAIPFDVERAVDEPTSILPPEDQIPTALDDALSFRCTLAGSMDVFRLVNSGGDRLPGILADRFGDWVVLTLDETAAPLADAICGSLLDHGFAGVYVRAHAQKASDPELRLGAPAPDEVVVEENGLQLAVRLDRASPGLFVDQRDNRSRVRREAAGLNVLNLFCHTGAFTVAAARGGARATTSIDVMKSALERARRNLELAGLSGSMHRLLRADAISWLGRAARRGERFDLVVLDPPTFGRSNRSFSMKRDYVAAARGAMMVMGPGAMLLAVTNHRGTTWERLRRTLHDAARGAGRRVRQMKNLSPPIDCSAWHDGTEHTKSVLVTLE